MKDEEKTKGQRIDEVTKLRKQVARLKSPDNESKQADKEQRKSQEIFRLLLEKASDGIVVVNRKGKLLYANEAAAKNLGYSKEEFMNLHITDIEARETETDFKKHYSDMLSGKRMNFETLHKKKDGSTIDVNVSLNVFDHEGKKVTYSIWRDISERKKTEKALKESEERYRTIFENIMDIYYRTDSKGNLLLVSPSAAKIFGYKKPQEMIGKSLTKDFYYRGEDREKSLKDLKKHIGKLKLYQLTLKRKDGTPIFFETNSHFIYDKTGKPIGTEGILRDITGRKKVESVLKESEKKYRDLFESTKDGIVFTDMQGKIIDANQAYLDMLGYKKKEIKKLRYQQITPEKWYKYEAWIVEKQFVKRSYSDEFEKEYIKKDGTVFPISIRGYLIKDKRGRPVGMWGFIRDITEQKKTKEMLQKSHDELEIRVKERTEELAKANDELQKQKASLEQKNIALREIVEQIDREKKKIKDDVATNVDELLIPILAKLKTNTPSGKYIDLLKNHLEELTSSFGRKITEKSIKLTSREIEICNMVKGGLASKDISNLLTISFQTVKKHRKNIRHKLRISNKDVNLTSYLHQL